MRFLNIMGNSFGCSASGERLVSAARDGDLQEAKALLEYNPRLARYSTIGVRNSPLHYSAAQGHHEIVSLLLESGVDINLRNYRGQTALMQACQHGHWEVVQTLMIFKANICRVDYLNGGTALHFAALNGHSRCIRLLLVDYIPNIPDVWNILRKRSAKQESTEEFDEGALNKIINTPADGGITALHMAALNGHVETVQLLLDLGACISEVTVEDGTTIDLIGAGSTPLHYAACGGNMKCCQVLIARGASLTAENANGEFGWRNNNSVITCLDPCAVCLERKCTVAAEGCGHEFCTRCALYLCSTNSTSTATNGPPGSIACPLCRHGIVSFVKLPGNTPRIKEIARTSLSLTFCACSTEKSEPTSISTPFCKADYHCARISPIGSSSFRNLSCQNFPLVKLNSSFCMGAPDTSPSLVPSDARRNLRNHLCKCSRSSLRRSASHHESRRSWLSALNM
ncbi:probable E3 ubiquitin-protein ligase XBOS32 isoform X2 [Telopea speciosissima]|uniref:probable E3 ubiquitin-protein ligase XBOS32 isoform X2 n=1 Tax=Telopea speciosissima TaxID=54955 RepID=UPI001CC62F1F|nr:probable E3 ubiquitin-protein ligase XBOS32 isoform X2 [Telopea speciosissima]